MSNEDIVHFINSHNLKILSNEETVTVVTEFATHEAATLEDAITALMKKPCSHLIKKTAKEYIVDVVAEVGSSYTKVYWAANPDEVAKLYVEAEGPWEEAIRISKTCVRYIFKNNLRLYVRIR